MQSTLLVLLLVAAAPGDAELRERVKARIAATVAETKTLTWYQDAWSTNGKKEEATKSDCFFMAPEMYRLKVIEGRVNGATAIYRDGKITGFKPGVFSFVKLTYDVRDKEVLGVRGQDMRSTGFLDDYALILKQWDSVSVVSGATGVEVTYTGAGGFPAKLWMAADSLVPTRMEVYESGKTVERVTFEKIKFNPPLDPKLFVP